MIVTRRVTGYFEKKGDDGESDGNMEGEDGSWER